MGHWIECKKTYRYDGTEIENIGTTWHPIWNVKCHYCGDQIIFELAYEGVGKLLDDYVKPKKCTRERAETSDIREYWIQEYVKVNYKKLGFSKIEGPFDSGPDFKGIYKGENVLVEVERDCNCYIEHKHHISKFFMDVSILIVLNPAKPSEDIKGDLPPKIIYIDIDLILIALAPWAFQDESLLLS